MIFSRVFFIVIFFSSNIFYASKGPEVNEHGEKFNVEREVDRRYRTGAPRGAALAAASAKTTVTAAAAAAASQQLPPNSQVSPNKPTATQTSASESKAVSEGTKRLRSIFRKDVGKENSMFDQFPPGIFLNVLAPQMMPDYMRVLFPFPVRRERGDAKQKAELLHEVVIREEPIVLKPEQMSTNVETSNIDGNSCPDSTKIANSDNWPTVRIFDNTGNLLHELVGHSNVSRRLEHVSFFWSHDSSKLATSIHNEIFIWDVKTGERIGQIGHKFFCDTNIDKEGVVVLEPRNITRKVAWSNKGDKIAVYGHKQIMIFDVNKSCSYCYEFKGHRMPNVILSQWSPDDKFLASITYHGEIKIWDNTTRKQDNIFKVDSEAPNLIYWEDSRLVVGFNDGKIYIFDPESGTLICELDTGVQDAYIASFKWDHHGNIMIKMQERSSEVFSTKLYKFPENFFDQVLSFLGSRCKMSEAQSILMLLLEDQFKKNKKAPIALQQIEDQYKATHGVIIADLREALYKFPFIVRQRIIDYYKIQDADPSEAEKKAKLDKNAQVVGTAPATSAADTKATKESSQGQKKIKLQELLGILRQYEMPALDYNNLLQIKFREVIEVLSDAERQEFKQRIAKITNPSDRDYYDECTQLILWIKPLIGL